MRLITFLLKDKKGKNTIPAFIFTESSIGWISLKKKYPELAMDKGAKQTGDYSFPLAIAQNELPLDQMFFDKSFGDGEHFIEAMKEEGESLLIQTEQLGKLQDLTEEMKKLKERNKNLEEAETARKTKVEPFVDPDLL